MKKEITMTTAEKNEYLLNHFTEQRRNLHKNNKQYVFLTELIEKRKAMIETNITELEEKMLIEIMTGETDGPGMGYSETDGRGFTPEQKGTLSSLIKKGLVYDSEPGDEDDLPMYCTRKTPETEEMAQSLNEEY